MEDSSNSHISCDGECVEMILNQKTTGLKCDLRPLDIDSFSCSDCDVSSVVSLKEGCESPLSSWDSEPETDVSSIISCHEMPEGSLQDTDLEGNYLDMEEQNQFVGVENMDDGFLWEMDNRSYDELLKKFVEKEEELRVSNFKFQLSEQEIIKLSVQVENSEGLIDDMREKLELKEDELYNQKGLSGEEIFKLQIQILKSKTQLDNVRGELNLKNGQLDNVRKELELKEEELNEQKKLSEEEIFKLKIEIKESENQLDSMRDELNLKIEEMHKQTDQLDTHIPDIVNKITNLKEKLEATHKKLKISKDEIATLRQELASKSYMTNQLQCQIKEKNENTATLQSQLETLVIINEDNDINHEEEVRELNSKLLDLQVKFSREKEDLNFDIANLSKLKKQLTSKLEDCEKKVMRYEDEKLIQKKQQSHLMVLHDEISYLRKELVQRRRDLEAANKKSDKVMVERDEANVKINKLKDEICFRDNQISHMKKYMDELNTSQKELLVDYRTKLKEEKRLIQKVAELEQEVYEKNGVILDMAEEKKEAIRQLCNSLEHYRSENKKLVQVLNGL